MILKVLEAKTKRSGKRVLCRCDNCGKEFISKLSEQTRRNKKQHFCCWDCFVVGYVATEKAREIARKNFVKLNKSRNQKLENNPHWKGGITRTQKGYLQILVPGHPNGVKNYILLHRFVMENFIGRYLLPEEVVHHIDGDKNNNDIENLMLFKNGGEHSKHHARLRKMGMARFELIGV